MFAIKFSILTITVILLSIISSVISQRSPYAGSRPNGYHDRLKPQTSSTTEEIIVNRFGDDNSGSQRPPVQGVPVVEALPNFASILPISTTTLNPILSNRINTDGTNGGSTTSRLPYDAYNDHYLVDNYNRGPIDNRPFWLINAEHIERQRNLTSNQVANFNPVAAQSSFLGSQG